MKERLYLTTIILFSFLLYALTLRGVSGNPTPDSFEALRKSGMPFESSLARGRFAQTMAIAEDHTFDLQNGKERIPIPDLGFYNGRFYSLFAPGVSFISVPIYNLGVWLGASQLTVFAFWALIAVTNSALIFTIARKLQAPLWASAMSAIVYASGTTAWPYAVTLAQHTATNFFLLLILLSAMLAKKSWKPYLIGWTAYGLAISVDYINAVLLAPAVLLMLIQALSLTRTYKGFNIKLKLSIFYTIFPLLLLGIANAYYNQINFGNPTTVGTSVLQNVKTQEDIDEFKNLSLKKDETQNYLPVSKFFQAKNFPQGISVLLFSRGRGIIFFAPVVLLGLLGLVKLFDTKVKLATTFTILVTLNLMMYSAFGDPWGGWEYGPRYLMPSMAILSILLAVSLKTLRKIWFKVLTWILLLYSASVNMLGALTTNQLPASVEAVKLNLPYTYLYNLQLLQNGKSYGFVYSSYLSAYMTATHFATFIILAIASISAIILFSPLKIKKKQHLL